MWPMSLPLVFLCLVSLCVVTLLWKQYQDAPDRSRRLSRRIAAVSSFRVFVAGLLIELYCFEGYAHFLAQFGYQIIKKRHCYQL